MTRIVFAGGGTAGHVFPAIAVARALQRLDPSLEPVFVGVADRLEDRLVPAAGFRMHHIAAPQLPRRVTPGLLRVPGRLREAVRHGERILADEQAVAVVSFGGYVSLPLARAASRVGLPLVVHEQNAVPGVANRLAARWADRIAVSFPGSSHRFRDPARVVVTGNPVREEMLGLDLAARRGAARAAFDLADDRLTVLVFGGSQGARALNRAVVRAQPLWADPDGLQILHAAGTSGFDETLAAWERARSSRPAPAVRCVDFIDDMGDAYAAADLVVCRAGATSMAELTALGLPSVLVPYPHATRDHQLHNARALAQVGGAQVVEDGDLTPRRLVDAVEPWIADPAARAAAGRAAGAFGRPDAATQVARVVTDVLAGPPPRPVPGVTDLYPRDTSATGGADLRTSADGSEESP
jgi:UDP-N-acetylglucosamine--N-acetylmuramyl-(pentapeptide) pyrophosphoryl-undecaprenol N-acetylglucosamine transferase